MKTAREVAHEQEAYYEDCPGPLLPPGKHSPACDRLTAAIEARDREVVEACAKAIIALPVVGFATVPYIAALDASIRAVRSLAPPPGGSK